MFDNAGYEQTMIRTLSKNANTKERKKMKIEIFTEGIGRVIASGYAMRHCISFLKSVYPKRFRWIKKDGIDFDMIYAVNYELRDKWIAENICPNCGDQASIAVPGQTTLCKTHEDEKHFRQMKEFFDEYIQEIILKPHMPFCSRCGADSPDYVLVLRTSDGSLLNFAACTNCRDELTLKQNAARAAQERIGA